MSSEKYVKNADNSRAYAARRQVRLQIKVNCQGTIKFTYRPELNLTPELDEKGLS
jgi:hypothetical protein